MLSLFGNKSDHPLANLKSAQLVLDDLPKTDSVEVLQEIGHWIEALFDPANEFRLDHQFAVLRMLDDAAHPHLRKIIHSYFAAVPPNEFQEKRLWGAMNAYFTCAELGYLDLIIGLQKGEKGSSLIKAGVALISARGIYAAYGRMECAAVQYAQVEPLLWRRMADFYAYAEAEQCLDEQISIYAGLGANTSVRCLFAGALMWHSAVAGAYRPLDLHIAKRLIANMDKSLAIGTQRQADSLLVFDLSAPAAPARLAAEGGIYPPAMRFVSIGTSSVFLDNLLKTLDKNLVPAELNMGVAYGAEVVANVAQRLAAYCQARLPVRRPPRRRIKIKINVLNGFFNVVEETHVDLNLNDPVSENWEVEDISANGIRCVFPEGRGRSVKIGTLLGFQPQKSLHWGVGIVRRLRRDAKNNLHVGVRILANKVSSVALQGQDGYNVDAEHSALLLDRFDQQASESVMLMKQDIFSVNRSPTMKLDDQSFLLLPLALEEKGLDFDIVRYRKMAQDSTCEEAY